VPVTVGVVVGVVVLVAVGVLVGDDPPLLETLTALKATVLNAVALCAVTARPASREPKNDGKFIVDPGMRFQVEPSLDM